MLKPLSPEHCLDCDVEMRVAHLGGMKLQTGPGWSIRGPRSIVDAQVCPLCGRVQLFVRDPALFAGGNAQDL